MSIKYPSTANVTPTGSVYNDSSSVYGSAQLIFSTGTYDSADFTPEYGSSRKEQTDRFNVPTKAFATPTTPNGNCTIMVPATSTSIPAPGASFTADVTGTIAWLLDKIGTPYKKDDFLTYNISYSQKLN
jgi:hypothetical protein